MEGPRSTPQTRCLCRDALSLFKCLLLTRVRAVLARVHPTPSSKQSNHEETGGVNEQPITRDNAVRGAYRREWLWLRETTNFAVKNSRRDCISKDRKWMLSGICSPFGVSSSSTTTTFHRATAARLTRTLPFRTPDTTIHLGEAGPRGRRTLVRYVPGSDSPVQARSLPSIPSRTSSGKPCSLRSPR